MEGNERSQAAVGVSSEPIHYVGGREGPPEGSGFRALAVALAAVLVLLSGAAIVANALLTSFYSPERTIQDYFAAQSHGDASGMYSRANFLGNSFSTDNRFDLTAIQRMMALPANADLREIHISGERTLGDSARSFRVSLRWAGRPWSRELTVRKDPSRSHLLVYPDWRVLIQPSTINLELPNQPGKLTIDGVASPLDQAEPRQVIPGYHRLDMARTPFWNAISEQISALDSANVTIVGTINAAARTDIATSILSSIHDCNVNEYCFDRTYTAPKDGNIHYLILPGYGNVDYLTYSSALAGDPTADMTVQVSTEPNKGTATGSCRETLTINGSAKYQFRGTWNAPVTWTPDGFEGETYFDCHQQRG